MGNLLIGAEKIADRRMIVAAVNPIIVKPKFEFRKFGLFFYGFDSIFHRTDINAI
jgi:hypothetical protein